MTIRLGAALCIALAAACVSSVPPTVHIYGRVLLTVCPGNPPRTLPPGTSPCSVEAIGGATVIFAPMEGDVATATTDPDGNYAIDIAPGPYMVAATGPARFRFASQPSWIVIPNRSPIPFDIRWTLPTL